MMVARLSAANIDSTLRQVQSVLMILSERSPIRDPDTSTAERQSVLDSAFRQLAHTSHGLFYLDLKGNLLVSSSLDSEMMPDLELIRVSDLQARLVPLIIHKCLLCLATHLTLLFPLR